MDNPTIALKLEAFAAMLELAEASPFGVRAYRHAADLVRGTPLDVAELVRQGEYASSTASAPAEALEAGPS